jgi:ankyrin repeat protein
MTTAVILFAAPGLILCQDSAAERLVSAVLNSDFDAARAEIEAGADVNGVSVEGLYPIHYAVNSEMPRMVRFLIENKADVNARETEGGYTPLHLVCRKNFNMAKNRLEIAVILIAAGADVNAVDDSGTTSLHMAVTGGLEELARLLIEYGADVNARTGYHELTPLHQASSGGHLAIIKLLLEKGADVNSASAAGWTPLHAAKNRETAELLVNNGANVNAVSQKGLTPLSEAVSVGDVELARYLVGKGADVSHKLTNTKRTLLHYAGSAATAAYLLSLGIGVDTRDTWGYTPLHMAADMGNMDVAEFLINRGAEMNAKITWFIRNDDYPIGSTPLDIALDNDPQSELVKYLEAKGAKTGRYLPGKLYFEDLGNVELELFRAARNGNISIIAKRIGSGADINAKDNAGWTPLHWAAYFGRNMTVRFMIKNGARVNERSAIFISKEYPAGQTPLDVAETAGKDETAKILRSGGGKKGR